MSNLRGNLKFSSFFSSFCSITVTVLDSNSLFLLFIATDLILFSVDMMDGILLSVDLTFCVDVIGLYRDDATDCDVPLTGP